MGVKGLTTYVEGDGNFFQDVKFRDSRLVIDGCSLYFRLYYNHKLDQLHGGDYDAFACRLNQFFSALAACNIQPYVILDGAVDPSDKKFTTLRERLQSKIEEADDLSHGRNGSVLPILTSHVFIQVLIQRGVPVVQCTFEADREIACLAHKWKCPVLSNDSDFYIFDLPGGYLPLTFFDWTNLNGEASHRYISARCYTTDRLCHLFGGMNRELLPLFAVLAGNDYCAPEDVETLLSRLNVDAVGSGRGRSKRCTSRIEGLLLWLSSFSCPAHALEEVSSLMEEEEGRGGGGRGRRGKKGGISSKLLAGMQEYHITPQSSLDRWFSGVKEAPGGAVPGLPECLWLAVAQGLLNSLVINVVFMQRVLLHPQVENSTLASGHCSARAIRQAVYGILLQTGHGSQDEYVRAQAKISQGTRGGRGCRGRDQGVISHTQQVVNATAGQVQLQVSSVPVCVEEYDRHGTNLKRNQVEAGPPRAHLCLDTLSQIPVAVRLGVLLEVLGVKESDLAPVPLHLRIAIAVTGYWMREARPAPSQPQLQALVLCLVHEELSRSNQPRPSPHDVPQLNRAAEHNAALDGLRVKQWRQNFDIAAAHSFSQWQACLWSTLCLNQILLLPMPEPHLSWLFSGTLVHGLLASLNGGQAAESLLVGGMSGQLYSSLLDAVRNSSSKTRPSSSAARGRRRRRGRERGRGGGRLTEEINNRFALLLSEED